MVANFAPWLYVVFVTFIVAGTSNGVNLADGLDGLATGLTAIAAAAFAIFAYVFGRTDATTYLNLFYLAGAGELTIFLGALMGGASSGERARCQPPGTARAARGCPGARSTSP